MTLVQIIAYSPDEARDEHGKWTSGAFMDEFNKSTVPAEDGARLFGNNVHIKVTPGKIGDVMIDMIRSREQGKGHGREALKFLTVLADKHWTTLRLLADPLMGTRSRFDERRLIAWYGRHGFRRVKPGSNYMVRTPNDED